MTHFENNLVDLDHYIAELETWVVDAENNEAELSYLSYCIDQLNVIAVEFEDIRNNLKDLLECIDKAKEVRL